MKERIIKCFLPFFPSSYLAAIKLCEVSVEQLIEKYKINQVNYLGILYTPYLYLFNLPACTFKVKTQFK